MQCAKDRERRGTRAAAREKEVSLSRLETDGYKKNAFGYAF
jgi:hypothetical protein